MGIEPVVDSIINVIKKNMVARANITSNVTTGDITIFVDNSFHFMPNQEIVLIDYNYNVYGSNHYQIFEYSKIKEVNNTRAITVTSPIVGNWLVSDSAFIQKTIGHSPLYEDKVYYGDQEVIPTDLMAVTVEPVSMKNEWIYLQGGLDEEYRLKIMIYGKEIKFEDGRRILDRYSDAIVQLLNSNIHIGIMDYSTPLVSSVGIGDTQLVIQDTPENRENIKLTNLIQPFLKDMNSSYQLQDNGGVSFWFNITNIVYSGGLMHITISLPAQRSFVLSEYAVLKRFGQYLWDSRASDATYGVISKGSALLRASEINWFGRIVNEFSFPQKSLNLNEFEEISEDESSSSSSSSSSSP